MTTNYLRVTNGFDILTKALAPYVAGELRARYADEWWGQGVLRIRHDDYLPSGGEDDELTAALDTHLCLVLINAQWNELFRGKLDRQYRAWVNELIAIRNKWAHKGHLDMADEDAWRALDTMIRLVKPIDAEAADRLGRETPLHWAAAFVEPVDAGEAERLRALARTVRYGAEGPSTTARNAGQAPRPQNTSKEAREIPKEISELPTTSAKIRALDAEGWSKGDIARALGIPQNASREARKIAKGVSELPTKSAKIRALDAEGWSKGDIARALEIRYQHVWNVLRGS